MSKPNYTNWRLLLLLCAAAFAFAGGPDKLIAGNDVHIRYLPVIVNHPPIYLPVIFKNSLPYPYTLQPGNPIYLGNFINDAGCNWFGIAGRAFGLDGNPVIGLTVHLEGGGINVDTSTGSGPSSLGHGSYQIPINDHPIETTGVYFIQLRTSLGRPLSGVFMIPTHAQCSMNLVLVSFTATQPEMGTPTPTPTRPTQISPTPTMALPNTPTPTRAP